MGGLCTGAFAGSTTGVVGGGALGYGGFTHRKQLNDGAMGVWNKMHTSAASAKAKAADSASQLRNSMTSLLGGSNSETAKHTAASAKAKVADSASPLRDSE